MIEKDLSTFLKEWYSPSSTLKIHTSGSTGPPKDIIVCKERMWNSAAATCEYLKLEKGETALLCMPLQYIAGKMMVVRSIYANMNLITVEPSGNPLNGIHKLPDFAAMIPLQVYNSLQDKEQKAKLAAIKTLIIGGGSIDVDLQKELRDFPNNIYSTYGMTETLSHIALRKLSGKDRSDHYIPLPDVNISLASDSTLIIDAPRVCENKLKTNDIAEIYEDGSFIIIGRKDNIINSGGIKIQIERLEEKLNSIISYKFAITSIPDAKFGEKIVLLIATNDDNKEKLKNAIKEKLDKFEYPKHFVCVDDIPTTGNKKIDRASCKRLAIENLKQIK